VRISIGTKISAGFLLLLVLMGVSGILSYAALGRLQVQYEQVLHETYLLALTAEQLNAEYQMQSQLTMAYAATRDDRLGEVMASRKRVDAHTAQLKEAGTSDPEIASHTALILEQQSRFYRMVDGLFSNGEGLEAYQLVLQADNARALGEALGRQTASFREYLSLKVQAGEETARAQSAAAVTLLTVVIGLSVVLGIGVMIFVNRVVALPLRAVANQLRDIASGGGDLTRELKVTSNDEIGLLADSFNHLVRGLADMVRRLADAADNLLVRSQAMESSSREVAVAVSSVSDAMSKVASGAMRQTAETSTARGVMEELGSAIEQIASGAQQQAHQVQETTAVINTVVRAMGGVAQQAAEIANASREAANTAHQGARVVDQTLEGMNRVRDQVLWAAEKVSALGEHGNRIGEIMQVITEIAGQTNLLALNAAIEAARAGEQGRGFAVVAEEVRKLAERSATSASEIRGIIASIQSGTGEAVSAIQAGTVQVEEGARLASMAGEALKGILAAVETTSQNIQSISDSAQSVLASSREAARSVEEVAAVTQENTAATEEMAAGADEVQSAILGVNRISSDNASVVTEVSSAIMQVDQTTGAIAESAKVLSGIAAELRSLVGQFRL
jgi:methyl-accepting chemotaxis protein